MWLEKTLKWKNDLWLNTTQNDEEMHYKITIFGACPPYATIIYWIASPISQGKKDDRSSGNDCSDYDDDDNNNSIMLASKWRSGI